jgi:hypothetical protein
VDEGDDQERTEVHDEVGEEVIMSARAPPDRVTTPIMM